MDDPVNYAAIMQAGQGLVPDLRDELMRRQQLQMINDQRRMAMAQQQDAVARRAAFRTRLAQVASSGNPRAYPQLMMEFPEFADAIKPGWDAMSEDARRRNLTTMGSAFIRAQSGDYAGAATILEARHAADQEAGTADQETADLIAALRGDDPQAQRTAASALGLTLAAQDPDKFGSTMKDLGLGSDAKPTVEREYAWRVGQFGQQAADSWLASQDTKLVPVQPGGQVYAYGPESGGVSGSAAPNGFAPSAKGGDPSAGGGGIPATGAAIERAARSAVPGLTVTSGYRSPAHNAAVGGVSGSYHITDQARDFTPPAGMSMAQLHARLRSSLPGFDVINEGDHVHVEPNGSRAANRPVRVRSVQEARALPAGTLFITPDGRTMRKP